LLFTRTESYLLHLARRTLSLVFDIGSASMKFLTSVFLFFYCAFNWFLGIVNAFSQPQLGSKKNVAKSSGFYSLINTGSLTNLLKRDLRLSIVSHNSAQPHHLLLRERLGMRENHSDRSTPLFPPQVAGSSPCPDQQASSPWWSLNSLLSAFSPPSAEPKKVSRSDSGQALNMIMRHSADMNRARSSYTYTNVAGFMEYDPKAAAAKAHLNYRNSLNRKWFQI
jgi:hypothetical protein